MHPEDLMPLIPREVMATWEQAMKYGADPLQAFAAALAAWPGAGQDQCDNLILPLPPEGGDA